MRSCGINNGSRYSGVQESDSHYQVIITETVLPGKKGKGKFVRPIGEFAPMPFSAGNPIQLDTQGNVIIDISDINDCNCLLVDEMARVRWDVPFGCFAPVGSHGLLREVQADGDVTTSGGGTGELLQRGSPISPTATVTVESYGIDTDITDGTKFWVNYTPGSIAKGTGNQIYRPGGWTVLTETSVGAVEDIIIKAPEGGIPPRSGNLLGTATCDVYSINGTGQLEDTSTDETVLNWALSAVCTNGSRYGIATFIDGNWVVIAEDCSDDGGVVQPATGIYTSGTHTSTFPDLESAIIPGYGSYVSGIHTRTTNLTTGFE